MSVATAAAATPLPAPAPAAGRPNVILAGFMGTGKTAVGRELAHLLSLPFLDLDDAIVARAGEPIARIFERGGEAAFRAIERAVVNDAALLSGTVIATGGGAPLDAVSFRALAAPGRVAVLAASPDELARRLAGGGERPLLAAGGDGAAVRAGPGQPAGTRARIEELLLARAPVYDALGPSIDTTGREPREIARQLAAAGPSATAAGVPDGMCRLTLRTPDGETHVVIGEGTLGYARPDVRGALAGISRAAIVVDASVAGTHGLALAQLLADSGIEAVGPFEVPAGEAGKTVEVLAGLWERFRGAGLDPTCAIVAVGGGATLDVAGFAAATYARGLRLVNVPTTTLAMADAAIGGKVAIDHAGAKNLVGAFHPAALVIADTRLCDSLPDSVRRQGLAEVAKCAVLASPLVLDLIADAPLSWSIEQAVRVKAAYIEADPRDRGARRSLNLGHTFAHALESASDHGIAHGDAVAIGLVAAARLGVRAGTCEASLPDRIVATLRALDLPVSPPKLDEERVLAAMGADKKRAQGAVRFVVPAAGGAALLSGIDPREALAMLR